MVKFYKNVRLSHVGWRVAAVGGSVALGCSGADRKTAPVAPSGVIAACSARELATALRLKAFKFKHELGLGSKGSYGIPSLEVPALGATLQSGESTIESSRTKSSSFEVELPEDELCIELGYRPQLGRWTFTSSDPEWAQDLNELPCVISDTNCELCRDPTKDGAVDETDGDRMDQLKALTTRRELALADQQRYRGEKAERERKRLALKRRLRECMAHCACATQAPPDAGSPATGCCPTRCKLEAEEATDALEADDLGIEAVAP